jgi:hypothetical protein
MINKFFHHNMSLRRMALSASQVKHTCSILKPEAQYLSPALGLITKESNAFCGNLLRLPTTTTSPHPTAAPGLHQASLIANELFFQRATTEPPAITRSKSKAAYWMNPRRLGHCVGFALSAKTWNHKDMEQVLTTTGIVPRSTKAGRRVDIDGISTNISLSRFLRLCTLVSEGHAECKQANVSSTPLLLLLRFLWEKSLSKQCLLDFLETVHGYHPIFKHNNALEPGMRQSFLQARFSRDVLEDTLGVEAAALRLLSTDVALDAANDVELVAASLSSANAHKPAIKLSRHGFNKAEDKPDCVEVVVREMFDLLLFDALTDSFNPSARLPPEACSRVRAFYEQHANIFVDDDDGAIEAARSKQWFELCSGLGGGVEYTASSTSPLIANLSTVSSQTKKVVGVENDYELVPSLANVAKTMGVLLFGHREPELHSLADVATRWSTVQWEPTTTDTQSKPDHIVVHEDVVSFRAPMSEEVVHREVGGLRFEQGHHSIEFDLEKLHNLAITRHKRAPVEWTAKPKVIARQQWLNEMNVTQSHRKMANNKVSPFVHAIRPALLGDSMLQSMEEHFLLGNVKRENDKEGKEQQQHVLCQKTIQGWLSTRWGEDRRSMSTLEETDLASCSAGGHLFSSTDKQATAEELDQVKRTLQLLQMCFCGKDGDGDGDAGDGAKAHVELILGLVLPKLKLSNSMALGHLEESSLLHGLTGEALSSASIIEISTLLCKLPEGALASGGFESENSGDGGLFPPLLLALVRHRAFGVSLLAACQGLSFADRLLLIRCSVM